MRRPSRVVCALLGVFASAVLAMPAAARVGVTSATDGDPTGKPPVDAERILRVGIDVVADETITTHANDRAHLVFLDGTALTVSPNARLKIDRFVYDPASQTGDIAITATRGVFRLVGGKISKSNAITVQTPSASLGLRGGISLFTVDPQQTTAQFLFGKSLVVTGNGHTEKATRPGTEILAVTGMAPGAPVAIPPGVLTQPLRLLEASQSSTDRKPDATAKQSGFSDRNSGGTWTPKADALRLDKLTNSVTDIVAQAKPLAASLPLPSVPPPPPPAIVAVPTVTGPICYDAWKSHHHFHHR
jgi:hypothetical protein